MTLNGWHIVHPNFIHTTHIHTNIFMHNSHKLYSYVVSTQTLRDFGHCMCVLTSEMH